MLSDRVFQSILPLKDRELCPYEEVFTFGIWSRFFNLKSNHKVEGQSISQDLSNNAKYSRFVHLVQLKSSSNFTGLILYNGKK